MHVPSKGPFAPQPSSAIVCSSSSPPLSQAFHAGQASNDNQHAAELSLVTRGNNPVSSFNLLRSKPLAKSAKQSGSQLPNHTPHGFRSGHLSLSPLVSKVTHPTRDNLAKHDVCTVKVHAPLSLIPDKANLEAIWVDDTDSDTPLASAFQKTNQHANSTSFKQRQSGHTIHSDFSSDRTQIIDHSRPLSSLPKIQSTPMVNMESMRMVLDNHGKSRRILRLSSGSLIHVTMNGFINRVDLSPLRFLKVFVL